MVDFPDGYRRYSPGVTVEMDNSFANPWTEPFTLTIAAGSTGNFTLNFTDASMIYYVDQISITPGVNKEFVASVSANSLPVVVAAGIGWLNLPLRQCPSLCFINGDSLYVEIGNQDASQRTFTIKVNGTKIIRPASFGRPPDALFTRAPIVGDLGTVITFTDASSRDPTSWDWDFGDGSAHSTLQNPTHQYNELGTFNVTLIATNPFGTDTYVFNNCITISTEEMFNTYTEVDGGGYLTIASSKITFTTMPANVASYVYKDFGVNYFDGFDMAFEVSFSLAFANCMVFFCGLANAVGELWATAGVKLCVMSQGAAGNTPNLYVVLLNGNSITAIDSASFGLAQTKYCRFLKVAGSTTATLYIYNDAAHTDLFDTLSITNAGVNTQFRYLYGCSSGNSGTASQTTGYVDHLVLW